MPSHTITLSDGQSYRCPDSESLLRGMETLGKKGIPVGCRNGGCGQSAQVFSTSYTRGIF